MSQTTLPPPVAATYAGKIRNDLLLGAESAPQLIVTAETADPDLAAFLKGQALITSRTFYGPLISGAITWAVGHWALGWDAATVNAATGLVGYAVAMVFRALAKAPITGVFKAAPVVGAAPGTMS